MSAAPLGPHAARLASGAHLTAGLVAQGPSFLPDGAGEEPLALSRGGQQLVVGGPVGHAVAHARLGERRHPAAEAPHHKASITARTNRRNIKNNN